MLNFLIISANSQLYSYPTEVTRIRIYNMELPGIKSATSWTVVRKADPLCSKAFLFFKISIYIIIILNSEHLCSSPESIIYK